MAHWKLKVYLAFRLVQVLAIIGLVLALIGLVAIAVGGSEPRGGGAVWIDVVRSNLPASLGAFAGSAAVVVALGITIDRLGKRWKRQVGKYR